MSDQAATDDRDPPDVAGDVGVLLGGRDREARPGADRDGLAAVTGVARFLAASAAFSSATIAASSSAARASSASVRVSGRGAATGAAAGVGWLAGRAAWRWSGGRCPGRDVLPRERLAMVW